MAVTEVDICLRFDWLIVGAVQHLQNYWNHKCEQEQALENTHGHVPANGAPC